MTIKNNKGMIRNFKVLFEIENDNKKYIVYEDEITGNVYGGKLCKNNLTFLNDKEYDYLNKIVEKINS